MAVAAATITATTGTPAELVWAGMLESSSWYADKLSWFNGEDAWAVSLRLSPSRPAAVVNSESNAN